MNDNNQIGALSVEAKRELLKVLLSIRDGAATGMYPLSAGQQGLWFVYQLAPSSPAYNFLFAARLPADTDLDALTRAFQTLLCRHPALRTRFLLKDGKPTQKIEAEMPVELPRFDVADWSWDRLLTHLEARGDAAFDLEKGPAFRAEFYRRADEVVLLLVFHHLIADLWSMDLMIEELKELYVARKKGQETPLSLPRTGFGDYLRHQLTNMNGPRGQQALGYWLKELAAPLPVLDLPIDLPRPPVQTYKGDTFTWSVAPTVVTKLRGLAGKIGATLFPVMLSAFELLLHRYTGQSELMVGVTMADRPRQEWERLVGYYLNQIVVRARLAPEMSFLDVVALVRDRIYHGMEHGDYPFGEVVKRLHPHRDPSRSPVFQTMFIWDRPRAMSFPDHIDLTKPVASRPETLVLEPVLMEQRGAPCDLTLIVFEADVPGTNTSKITARLCYNTDLFHRSTIERMAQHLDAVLAAVVEAPEAPLAELALLSAAERQTIVQEWSKAPALDVPSTNIVALVEGHAARTPDAVAVEQEGRRLTYRELNEQANRLARYLEKQGVQPGDIVALHLPRCPEILVGVLAAWKLRAAWLYLDPAHPAQRLTGMVEDCQPALVLTASEAPGNGVPAAKLEEVAVALAAFDGANLGRTPEETDWAYVIYTSGSTGRPKGTVLTHRGLMPLWSAQREFFGLTAADRVLLFASFSFDASVYEMLMGLGNGAALILPTPSTVLPGPGLASLLVEKRVSITTMPPSIVQALPAGDYPDLRLMTVAGEACPAELVTRWAVNGRRVINAYGPTEATVCATWVETTPNGQAPTIGRPMARTQVYIVDGDLQPVPVGVSGELLLAGPGLALGYLGQPGLTAERFIPHPFVAGEVAYRTGDLVRWRADGQIEFLGRLDHQVKLRGHRIELEEIQEVLRQHPAVAEAAVIVREESGKGPSLAAYVVARNRDEFPLDAVREHLRTRLPAYMLPGAITTLEKMPLSGYGKVDRKALARIAPRTQGSGKPVAPRTPTEHALARVWCQVLGLESVGVHDNFFDLGGASIQTVELASRAAQEGLSLTPELVFRHQTIAELAALVTLTNESHTTSESGATSAGVRQACGGPMQPGAPGAVIESLGVYLPTNVLTTEDVLQNCKVPLDFPLERFTGIKSRRVVQDDEFSIDLARKAVAECLARTRNAPEDIDLVVCANISRFDGPMFRFSLEPTTAARLQREFGLNNAMAFDLTNACAGTFTAIWFVDTLLRMGLVKNGLIISGEYISHLTRTAQMEIQDFMDSRMACLTLGDAGQAILLERAPRADVGFHDMELFTLGRYHPLCVAKVSRDSHGGAIMHTDPVKSAVVTTKLAVGHCLEVLQRNRWTPESVRQLIMHQTSERTLDGAVQEINRVLGKTVVDRRNTVYNLAERGNCATNTHMLATWENIQSGRIQPGDRALYAVSGSGLVVGTAIYTFDDLPQRMREQPRPEKRPAQPRSALRTFRLEKPARVEAISGLAKSSDSLTMLKEAGEDCLAKSAKSRNDIDLILHTGVYHTEFLSEPALATIAAGELGINHDDESNFARRSFAFDLLNGGLGTLTACFVAGAMMQSGRMGRALITASEVENNAETWPENLLGLRPTASAFVLEPGEKDGFFAFGFRSFPQHVEKRASWTAPHDYKPAVAHQIDPDLEAVYLDCVVQTVQEFLAEQKVSLSDVAVVLPPWRSPAFTVALAQRLQVPASQVELMDETGGDLFTSSLPAVFARAREHGRLKAGELGLVIEVGAGVQVACALYRG
ncbi:MAG: amino acid adenylation domain-containing protein [Gemmataceae bacterium]